MKPKRVCGLLVWSFFLALTSCIRADTKATQFGGTISAKDKSTVYLANQLPGWYGSFTGEDNIYVMTPDKLVRIWKTGKVTIRGRHYPQSISFGGGQSVDGVGFHIDGFDFFDATLYGNWRVPIMGATKVVYLVYGDKELLYTSPPMESGHDPIKIHVPVTGVYKFWIETRAADVIFNNIWWCDAKLVKNSVRMKDSGLASPKDKSSKSNSQKTGQASSTSSMLSIAAAIGGLDLKQLRELDELIHKRIEELESLAE